MKIIYLDKNLYCTRAAYVWNGELWGFNAEDKSISRYVSNIYKAKIVRVVSGLEAVFVDLGKSKTGFLPVAAKDIGNYKEGAYLMCQVKRDYFGNKDMAVKEDITLAGNLVIYLPGGQGINVSKKISAERKAELTKALCLDNGEGGVILRTASEKMDTERIIEEINELKQKWAEISLVYRNMNGAGLVYKELSLCDRIKRDEAHEIDKIITNDYEIYKEYEGKAEFFDKEYDLFDYYGLSRDIEDIASKKVDLPNGGSLIFDYNETCTFIDVNTSKNLGRDDIKSTIFETNIIAAREIIRQLVLRNISGAILVDFISMKESEHNDELLEAINYYSKLDKVSTTVLGMTRLGLVEMTRRKTDQQRDSLLLDCCKSCNGTGKVFKAAYILCKALGKMIDLHRENNPKRFTVLLSSRLYEAAISTTFLDECKRRFPNAEICIVLDEMLYNTDYRVQI